MFWAVCRSSSGAPTVFAASGLRTHVETARSQVWVGTEFPLRLDYGRSPHAYVNQRLQIQLGLLMMSDIKLETCWAFNVLWNNKFPLPSCILLVIATELILYIKQLVNNLWKTAEISLASTKILLFSLRTIRRTGCTASTTRRSSTSTSTKCTTNINSPPPSPLLQFIQWRLYIYR